jgi:hypothetical protein
MSLTSELTGTIGISSSIRMFPEGLITLPAVRAEITSSGDIEYDRRRSGSSRMTTLRWLPPNGGGAETPGRAANIGRTRNNAWSWIWPTVLVSLDSTR